MHCNKTLLIGTLAALPDLVADYLGNIPAADLDRRRGEGVWTIREHLYHIVSVQEMLLGRMKLLKTSPGATVTPYFPQDQVDQDKLFASVEAALAAYRATRAKQLDLLASLSDQEWTHEAMHPEYRMYNIPMLANHLIFHENWHLYRIEELWLTRDEFFGG